MSKIDTITVGETTYDVGGTGNIAYGTCSTEAATAQKEVVLTSGTYFKLETGAIVAVKFDNTNTAENPTLKVGTTEAKPIWYNTFVITTSNLNRAGYANRYLSYMYDGTNWVWIGQSTEENTTYTPPKLGSGYGTCATEESTTAKTATLSNYELVTGGIVSVKFTNAVPASSTLSINSKTAKAIYYKGSAITDGIIKAGDVATFVYSGQYHLLAIDRAADIDSVYSASETLLRATVGWTGKNLLENTATTQTIKGVTFTVNADGSISTSGTANDNITGDFFINKKIDLKAGSYYVSGNPSGITGTLGLRISNDGYSYSVFFEQGKIITFNNDTQNLRVNLRIPSGQNVDNLIFKPMIRKADISDLTYEPYHKSVEDTMFTAEANGILGAKNLNAVPYTDFTKTTRGVTFTLNPDGSVTANGTNDGTGTSYFYIHPRYNFLSNENPLILPNGKYIASGCPNGGSISTYNIACNYTSNGNSELYGNDTGNGLEITLQGDDRSQSEVQLGFLIVIGSGQTVNNLVFNPMLRLASDPDDTYVPYVMTNKELTDKKISIEDLKTITAASSDFADFQTRIAAL